MIVREVGPGRAIRRIEDAARIASDGDRLHIHPGQYNLPFNFVWTKHDLAIVGVGEKPEITGSHNQGVLVLRGDRTLVENLDLFGATDRAAGGIRLRGSGLTCRRVRIRRCDNGIKTNNLHVDDPATWATGPVLIEDSEILDFGFAQSGQSHGMYVETGGPLIVRHCWIHYATGNGHLIKSRCKETHVFYNRLHDDHPSSGASQAIDVAQGGLSTIIGNSMHKGRGADSQRFIKYDASAASTLAHWGPKRVAIVNNTFVGEEANQIPDGPYPYSIWFDSKLGQSWPIEVLFRNNLCIGLAKPENYINVAPGTPWDGGGNVFAYGHNVDFSGYGSIPDALFAARFRRNYRLLNPGPAITGKGVAPGTFHGLDLAARWEYVHPLRRRPRTAWTTPGAFELEAA